MARVSGAIRAFNGGELSPYLFARDDTDIYGRGCITLINMDPYPQGPADKRRGTKYVGGVKDHTKQVRMIPFIFSEIDSYALEFGHLYIRFYATRARVVATGQDITAITKTNPAVVTYSGSDTYANGDQIIITGVAGMTEVNNAREYYTVANVNTGANTFELSGVDSTNFGTYTSGGSITEIYTVTSPYTEDDLDNIKYKQQGDIMYLTVGGTTHRPQKLSRVSATSWTVADMDNQYGPVLALNTTATTLTASGTTGTITVTASAALFSASHVGSVWELRDTSNTLATRGYFRITGFTSTTVVDATVQLTLPTTGATAKWYEAGWSGVQGYPRALEFHDGRLCFGGTNEEPLAIWGSAANEAFETFDIDDPTNANGAFKKTLTGQKNTIQWLVSDGDFLLAGTYGGLAYLTAGNEAISPTNGRGRNGSDFASSNLQGVLFNNTVKYAQRSKKKIYQAEYDDLKLNYKGKNLNIFNNIIINDTVSHFAILEEPLATLFMPRADGQLVGVTQEDDQLVTSWFRYITGLRDDDTIDEIESVAVIPGVAFDEIWMSVKRSINGTTKRYIEYIEPDPFARDYYVDCGITYSGVATTTITGLDHLEGEIVDVVVDGAAHPQQTVASGQITLDREGEEVVVGRPYHADIEPMLIEGGGEDGPSQGKPKRIHALVVRLYKTLGLKIGKDFDNLTTVPFRNVNDAMDSAPPLFGDPRPKDKEVAFEGTWDLEGNIAIRHDSPQPCTIIGFYPRFVTHDK